MTTVVNHALRQLRAGKLAIGLGLRQARTVDIAQIAKTSGFDWLFIDCEHNSMSVDTAAQIAAASLAVGITPIVRVPGYEHYHATRALDNGAQGVVVPARRHRRARAPDRRLLPLSAGSAIARWAAACSSSASRRCRSATPRGSSTSETIVVVMLESPQGIENCEAIAAVPGIDALLIGTNDLCFEMGIPGQFDHPRVVDAYAKVVAACRKHGKFPGMGGVYAPELLQRYIGMGVRLVLAGSDFALLMQAAGARASLVRGFEG